MDIEQTQRGFDICKFKDLYKQGCSLQRSSLATDDAIWLGVSTDLNGKKVNTRMHLDRRGVAALLPHLIEFVMSGNLEPTEEQEPLDDEFKVKVVLSPPTHTSRGSDTKIKATHKPTGLRAVVNVSRNPFANKHIALIMLRAGLSALTTKGKST